VTTQIAALALLALLLAGCLPEPPRDLLAPGDDGSRGEWPNYGNDAGGSRYSPLTEIDRENVGHLRVAWTYRTGETVGEPGSYAHYAFEATPLMVEGTLFFSTPYNRVIALDAETGQKRWAWDAKVDRTRRLALATSRGVSAWLDAAARPDRECRRRIFVGTVDARLVALDAATGAPCADFGRSGQIDLTEGINVSDARCCYQVTSPPAVVNGLVVVGSAIGDNRGADLERGVVRAYDARTGTLRWSWDPIPTRESDPARATWAGDSWRRTGAANVWSVMSVDAERGLVLLPTSSPSPDFYGGQRRGANVYANSVVALRAATGEVVWHFQVVHHDLWDYDVPAQPVLPARLTPDDAWGLTPVERDACRARISRLRSEGIFTPPSLEGTVIFPGYSGGTNWGGVSHDPARGLLITATNRLPFVVTLVPRDRYQQERTTSARPGREFAAQRGTPYGMYREALMSPGGLPCNAPPWGALTAVELATGDVRWEVPLGVSPELPTIPGSVNLGGALTTASGLIFIGAARDARLRAFDVETGSVLWSGELPASAQATPMTYRAPSGRQLVVIAAGGHTALRTKTGDHIVAFGLP